MHSASVSIYSKFTPGFVLRDPSWWYCSYHTWSSGLNKNRLYACQVPLPLYYLSGTAFLFKIVFCYQTFVDISRIKWSIYMYIYSTKLSYIYVYMYISGVIDKNKATTLFIIFILGKFSSSFLLPLYLRWHVNFLSHQMSQLW